MNATLLHIVGRISSLSANCLHVNTFLNPMYIMHLRTHRQCVHIGKTLLLNRKFCLAPKLANASGCLVNNMVAVEVKSTTAAKRCQGQDCVLNNAVMPPAPRTFFSTSAVFTRRWFTVSSSVTGKVKPEDLRKRVDYLTDCFAEARELLGDARESLGSSYFSDDMMEAQEAVSSTITKYEALLADLDEDQRNGVVRTIGLRMEELKAQEQAIKDLLD